MGVGMERRWAVWALLASAATPFGQAQPVPAGNPSGAQAGARQSKTCVVNTAPPSDAEGALAREDYDMALELYRKMLATAPDESREGVIRTLIEQDKPKDAEVLAWGWVKEQPKNSYAVESLGEVLFREGELPDAYQKNQEAVALDPCNARAYLMDAALEGLTANFKLSKTHIELAHRLAPSDVEIRHAWIGTLPRKRRREEREALLKEENLMSASDRESLKESLAHAGDLSKGDCRLVTPVETAKVPILPIMDGAYFTGEAGLDVNFDGKRRRLELDTGASGLMLSRSAASGLGIVRERKIESMGVGDKGNVATSTAHVASVKIGNLEFRNCEVEILEKGSALENGGLIGGDVFRKFLVTLDFPKRELRLDPLPKRPEDGAKAERESLSTEPKPHEDGIEGEEEEDEPVHDRYIAPEMKDWTKIYRYGHELLLPVQIGEARSRLFLVDTGAASMLISPDAAREVTKVKNNYDDRISGISGEVKKVYQTGKFTIVFAQLYQKVDSMTSIDTTAISHHTGVEVSGFMGTPILFRLTIHIDYRDNLIKFEFDPMKN